MKRNRWSVREFSRNVHQIDVHLPSVGAEQWVLLQSDVHWDSPYCDRDLLLKHLELAKERDAIVLDAGDFFDAMQGKWDPRSDKSELRPELLRGPYLDEIVSQAAEWLRPYQDQLAVRGLGNHETGIIKRHEFNLTQSLVDRLKVNGAKNIHLGGYSGWVKLQITFCQNRRYPRRIHYFHGSGGGGPVTRDMIRTNRMAVYLTNADIVWTGHTHDAWETTIARVELTKQMEVRHTEQAHIKTPGYKQEYADGYRGFHVETGKPPKPLGGYWLRFHVERGGEVATDVIRAK